MSPLSLLSICACAILHHYSILHILNHTNYSQVNKKHIATGFTALTLSVVSEMVFYTVLAISKSFPENQTLCTTMLSNGGAVHLFRPKGYKVNLTDAVCAEGI